MKILMSSSAFLQQLGSVWSGLKFRLSKSVTTCWGHSFGALRYPCNALCSFQTSSSHNSAKQCLVNVGMQECCVHVNCNCDAITFWMIVSIMRAHAQNCFQRQCRCEHLGLSAPVVTIDAPQNQNLDFTQPSFSRSTHRVCVTRFSCC